MDNSLPTNVAPLELNERINKDSFDPFFIDVREDEELHIAPFTYPVKHLPLSKSSMWIKNIHDELPKDRSIVVICHSGIRSLNFATWLIEQGWISEVFNLVGGIDEWSQDVDQSIARY